MTVKPYLLVDVDGVLVPFGAVSASVGYRLVDVDGIHRWLHPEHGTWLTDLAGWYELVWVTAWEWAAHELLSPLLGMPDMPVIEFGAGDRLDTWKLPDVERFVGDRPLAWIDDDLFDDARQWAEERGAATLLVRTDPAIGMTRDHVTELVAFAQGLGDDDQAQELSWDDRDLLLTEVVMGVPEAASEVPATPESTALRRKLEVEVKEMLERGIMPEHPKD